MQDLHGQHDRLRPARVRTHGSLYHVWEADVGVPSLSAVRRPRCADLQGLNSLGIYYQILLNIFSGALVFVSVVSYRSWDHTAVSFSVMTFGNLKK